ncbi:MAG: phosphatase PAP2 family protein [Nitrospirales bacterium]
MPCDRSSVPFFDRWVIAPTRPVAGRASDVLRASLWAVTWLELVDDGPVGHAGIVASLESTLWAEGAVHLVKALTGRKRPVLYTDAGIEVAHVVSNQRSWPSGHAATAAALATSYCLTRRKLSSDNSPGWRCWLAVAGAVGVGVLRMAAAKHYPSDVLAGFAAGTATAFVVHAIKF